MPDYEIEKCCLLDGNILLLLWHKTVFLTFYTRTNDPEVGRSQRLSPFGCVIIIILHEGNLTFATENGGCTRSITVSFHYS